MIGIFGNLVLVLLHFSIIALDITFFFLLMRFLSMQWQVVPLTTFADIGRPLIDWLIANTRTSTGVSYRSCFLVLSLMFTVARLLLVAIANSVVLAGA